MFDRHSEAYKVYGALTRLEQMASMNEVYRKENNIAGLQEINRVLKERAADQLRMKQGLLTGNPCEELKAEVNPGVSAVGQRVIAIAIFPCHINIAIASFDIQR